MRKTETGKSNEGSSRRWEKALRNARAAIIGAVSTSLIGAPFVSRNIYGSYIPPWLNQFAATQYLPDDPCTQIQPFVNDRSAQQRELARECIRDEKSGKIVIVDFTGLSKKTEETIAEGTEKLIRESSSSILTPRVIMIPASEKAKKDLAASAPVGTADDCVPLPPVYTSPSAIALENMPKLHEDNPDAFIVAFSPQIACNDAGLAYTGNHVGIATVYPKDMAKSELAEELAIVHEAGGHLFNLGHAGSVDFTAENFHPSFNNNPYSENISLPGSQYGEYKEDGDPMGNADVVSNQKISQDPPVFNQIDDDILRWPEAILHGDKAVDARFIGSKWTRLGNKEINKGVYAMVPLDLPVPLQGVNGITNFDTFAITLTYNPSRKLGLDPYPSQASYGIGYFLYDSQRTHNTAYPMDQLGFNANKSYTIHIGKQEIQMRGGKNGLLIRTIYPETRVISPLTFKQ